MAKPVALSVEANDQIPNKPWSKRAAQSPRKTYSAESSIVYKRKLHKWTLTDLERIQASVAVSVYETSTETTAGQRVWILLLDWMRKMTIELIQKMTRGVIPRWAIISLYDLVRDIGVAIIENSGWTSETKFQLYEAFDTFTERLLQGVKNNSQ